MAPVSLERCYRNFSLQEQNQILIYFRSLLMFAPAIAFLLKVLRMMLFLPQVHCLKYITSTFCSLNPGTEACHHIHNGVLGLLSADWFLPCVFPLCSKETNEGFGTVSGEGNLSLSYLWFLSSPHSFLTFSSLS